MIKLSLSILMTLLVGTLAALLTAHSITDWYVFLKKPSFNPPNSVFGPVWTILYILMGISFYLIWRLPVSANRNTAMRIFFVQLVLNFLWSFLFFNLHALALSVFNIVVLWVMILLTIFLFAKLNRLSAWLLVPYISWVSFAAILNVYIFNMNAR
jgi:translocator protein